MGGTIVLKYDDGRVMTFDDGELVKDEVIKSDQTNKTSDVETIECNHNVEVKDDLKEEEVNDNKKQRPIASQTAIDAVKRANEREEKELEESVHVATVTSDGRIFVKKEFVEKFFNKLEKSCCDVKGGFVLPKNTSTTGSL